MQKEISDDYGIEATRSASLLDIFASVLQGVIPYGARLLTAASLAGLTSFDIIPYLFYPYLMAVCGIISIIISKKKYKKSPAQYHFVINVARQALNDIYIVRHTDRISKISLFCQFLIPLRIPPSFQKEITQPIKKMREMPKWFLSLLFYNNYYFITNFFASSSPFRIRSPPSARASISFSPASTLTGAIDFT